MKLVKQTKSGFQYQLSRKEAETLRFLVKQFPVAAFVPVKISKTDSGAEEREKLLNESLVEHRNDLKRKVLNLIQRDKFTISKEKQFYRVSLEAREALLQILNDIRVESWRMLGEPEDLHVNILKLAGTQIRYFHLMHLAGYFECHFLNLEDEGEA